MAVFHDEKHFDYTINLFFFFKRRSYTSLKCLGEKEIKMFLFFLKESGIQLEPRDRGDDSWLLLLGLHSDSDSRRVYLLKAGCKQVTVNK